MGNIELGGAHVRHCISFGNSLALGRVYFVLRSRSTGLKEDVMQNWICVTGVELIVGKTMTLHQPRVAGEAKAHALHILQGDAVYAHSQENAKGPRDENDIVMAYVARANMLAEAAAYLAAEIDLLRAEAGKLSCKNTQKVA